MPSDIKRRGKRASKRSYHGNRHGKRPKVMPETENQVLYAEVPVNGQENETDLTCGIGVFV